MAWGLFAWRHHRLIPRDSPLAVRLLSPEAFDFWTHELLMPVQKLGAEVWWMSVADAGAKFGVWLFMLHGAAGVGVWQGDATRHPKLPSPHGLTLRPD